MLKETILLIDAFNVIISQNSVSNIVDNNSEPIGTYLGVINQIKLFTEKFKPIKVFFVMDGPNAGERRRKIYSNYKGKRRVVGRKSKIVLNEDDNEESYEVSGSYEKQLKKIYDFLKLLPVTVCIVPYCEADDVISNIALKNQELYRSVIVSTDKDYLQLVNENIGVYNWRSKKYFDQKLFIEEFQIKPSNFIFKKILRGDNSDEIKGISSLGEKTFLRMFSKKMIEDELTTMEDFFNYLDSLKEEDVEKKDLKHLKVLKEESTRKNLLINFRIMKLSSDYLKIHHIDILKTQIEEQRFKITNNISLKILMMKDSFNKLYGTYSSLFKPETWMNPFKIVRNNVEIIV